MSKKKLKKKKQQEKSFPWIHLVLVLALLAGAVAVFSHKNNSNVISAGKPAIAVDQQNIDMGYIKLGQSNDQDQSDEYRRWRTSIQGNALYRSA